MCGRCQRTSSRVNSSRFRLPATLRPRGVIEVTSADVSLGPWPGRRIGDTRRRSTTSAARSRSSASARPSTRRRRAARRARSAPRRPSARSPTPASSPTDIDGLTYSGAFADFDVAAFHEHFGTTHDAVVVAVGRRHGWAGTAPYLAAQAIARAARRATSSTCSRSRGRRSGRR